MKLGKINLVVDGQHGSTGKGLINSYLAWRDRPEVISCTNMANAGHTAILPDGTKFVAKALPSSTILNKLDNYSPEVVVGAGAAFTVDQLLKELKECGNPNLTVHPRAGVITQEHKERESELKGGTKHIASTMQGCGAFLADKVMRGPDVKLAGNYEDLSFFAPGFLADRLGSKSKYLPDLLMQYLTTGRTILHEGSQGFGLDINHGNQYPNCTSRQCTALQSVADMGLPHQVIGDVYMVIRPYPIRVGNVVEKGKTVGYSGDPYSDSKEITWEEVATRCGAPPEVMAGELTTVTKRLRRVFEWSDIQFRQAAMVNGATKIALNFANYVDWSCYGKNNWDELGDKVHSFIAKVEDAAGVRVELVGTGPSVEHVAVRP